MFFTVMWYILRNYDTNGEQIFFLICCKKIILKKSDPNLLELRMNSRRCKREKNDLFTSPGLLTQIENMTGQRFLCTEQNSRTIINLDSKYFYFVIYL